MSSGNDSSVSMPSPAGEGLERVLPLEANMLKRRLVQLALVASAIVWASDLVYKYAGGISYANREQCVLFRALPRLGFVIFEYLFETLILVFLGIFLAVLLGRWFLRFRRFYPRNPVTAFLYGSVIPVCACAVIPLLSSMKGRMKFTTTLSFVLAAPLLSPFILVLSFSVLGFRYGLLRVASSFVLVMVSASILGLLGRKNPELDAGVFGGCARNCGTEGGDVYLETLEMFKTLLPFLLFAAGIGILLEYLGPRTFLLTGGAGEGAAGVLAWILIGVPLYFCNGAEVLFLRPLVSHGFPMGTAIAFSMTSTAICTTSMAMLVKTIGTRLTVLLVSSVVLVSLGLALLINSAYPS